MQLVGAWLVWVADQSEAGFDEAQLATYGIRPFGSTGSCENITFTHSVARVRGCVGVGGRVALPLAWRSWCKRVLWAACALRKASVL